ncbi:recombination regulator RecX [Herbaspirillum chlorophenolicum]|uniref:recombination regulator RecX n=1 Tax=Herbaspirillum chlorophenolicum TaxID=211589 RepID=UPI00067DC066|nr:recombination regulator RecX [Herbaspirillum chlorophenolicum]
MPRPPISLKARALKYLSSREHSRLELARKLSPYAQEGDDVDALLNWLEQSRFLSSERFSESLVNRRAARYGNNRILSELQSHGIEGEALSELKSGLAEDEGARAAQVLRRKFSEPPVDAESRAKRMRFLQQRGFSHRSIREALNTAWSDEDGPDA